MSEYNTEISRFYFYICKIYIERERERACARLARGRGFEFHSGQLSIWNQKTLAQYEYHIYIYIYIYINIFTKLFEYIAPYFRCNFFQTFSEKLNQKFVNIPQTKWVKKNNAILRRSWCARLSQYISIWWRCECKTTSESHRLKSSTFTFRNLWLLHQCRI